eukprot:CAMPEP_0119104738 /NCGR_PEP_ID=MMETSP1180-20130426/2882_1 /TAXON_ID=3052 ORGANISM="Chlamydomonas cf sp, Strain CCMP681" /NCGR_SAMPLE_ID=MMETSP1180 /ASSEMBLY_ACC=CAM_ASM_000741 /LENGTH=48 /DNA_ID= /DNA_START= /DNA_END= /DNA_ORIENTATION=
MTGWCIHEIWLELVIRVGPVCLMVYMIIGCYPGHHLSSYNYSYTTHAA